MAPERNWCLVLFSSGKAGVVNYPQSTPQCDLIVDLFPHLLAGNSNSSFRFPSPWEGVTSGSHEQKESLLSLVIQSTIQATRSELFCCLIFEYECFYLGSANWATNPTTDASIQMPCFFLKMRNQNAPGSPPQPDLQVWWEFIHNFHTTASLDISSFCQRVIGATGLFDFQVLFSLEGHGHLRLNDIQPLLTAEG